MFLFSAGATGIDDDRISVDCGSGGNDAELSTNSACSKPEDELEKPPHRSSSLGVVSGNAFFTKIYIPVYYILYI